MPALLAAAAACTRSGGGDAGPPPALGGTCIDCHVGITSPHDRFALRCTDCHGGDQTVAVPDEFTRRLLAGDATLRTSPEFQAVLRAAHVLPTAATRELFYANGVDDDADGLVDEAGERAFLAGTKRASDPAGDTIDSEFGEDLNYVRFLNPGDLRAARASCGSRSPASRFLGQCHDDAVDAVRKSIMTTVAGVLDGAYYGNRQLPGDDGGASGPPPASNGDPRGGRFGYVLDWDAVDAQFDPALNRFTGSNRSEPGTIDDLDGTTATLDGKPLRFPGRALPSLSAPPDRALLDTDPVTEIDETARAIMGATALGFSGTNPVDAAVLGFRAFNPHVVPSPGRNFVFGAFPEIPPNPHGRGRASGCTGCHMLYRNDGHNKEPRDPTVRENGRQVSTSIADALAGRLDLDGQKFYPARHKITTRIPTSQCGLCHGFVTRIDQSFEGRWELEGGLENDRTVLAVSFTTPSGQAVEVFPNLAVVNTVTAAVIHDGEGEPALVGGVLRLPDRVKRSEAFDGRQLRIVYGGAEGTTRLRDVHLEKGMHCIDCHFLQDAHGDGNIYARNWDAIEIECDDCHGTPEALATLVTSGPNGGTNLRASGYFRIEPGGDRVQRSRVTPGLEWRIPQVKEAITPGHRRHNPRAEAAMGVLATSGPHAGENAHIAPRGGSGRLECYSCHNAFTPSCLSCHFNTNFDGSKPEVAGVNGQRGVFIDNEERPGFTDFALFGFTRSPFVLGKAGTTEAGKLAPFRSTMQVHASVSGPIEGGGSNDTILDNLVFTTGVPTASADIASGVAMNMFMPHTVRKEETRDCETCHTLVDAAGRVVNNHLLAGTFGYGTGRYDNLGDWLLVATDQGLRQVDFKKEQAGGSKNVWPGFVLSDDAPRIVAPGPATPAADVAIVKNFTPKGEPVRGVDLAFVAEGAAGVRVVDVTGRDTGNYVPLPDVVVATSGPANAVDHVSPDLSDAIVHVAAGTAGLQAIDLSGYFAGDPPAVTTFAGWDGSNALDVEVHGDIAWVAAGAAGLKAVRVRGAGEGLVGGAALVPAGEARKVAVMDRFAFVAAGAGGLQVFEITDPTAPVRVASLAFGSGEANGVALQGSKALVAGGTAGLHIVDITRPEAPVTIQTVKTFNTTDALADVRDVVVGSVPRKTFAVVADADRLVIFNLTDPLDWREHLATQATTNYKYSLERRDIMTPRDPTNTDLTQGALVFDLGGAAPRRIAPGASLDRLADEGGRRLRESWQEGAGVVDPETAARMRAVVVEEVPGTTDLDDRSGNGLGPLRRR